MRKKRVSWKIIAFIFLFILIWMLYLNFNLIVPYLQKSPFLWSVYIFLKTQIEQKSLLGLAFLSFFGSLFFIFVPIELVFIYYTSLEYNNLLVLFIVVPCCVFGLMVDYWIGFLLGKKLFSKKKNIGKTQKRFERFGTLILVVGHIFFFPMQFVTALFGVFRYPFKKLVVVTFIMLLIKFILILVARDYFIAAILPKIQEFL